MHAIEKILAKNSGRREVRTGEIVTAKVDFAEINDLYHQCLQPGFLFRNCGYRAPQNAFNKTVYHFVYQMCIVFMYFSTFFTYKNKKKEESLQTIDLQGFFQRLKKDSNLQPFG